MENPPFEDVFHIENGEFSNVMLVFRAVTFVGSWDVWKKGWRSNIAQPGIRLLSTGMSWIDVYIYIY